MPRIEFEHPAITKWYETEANGNGTSTFDLCTKCFEEDMTAKELNLTDKGYNGDPIPADAIAIDNESAPYIEEQDDYQCTCCGRKLKDNNYY